MNHKDNRAACCKTLITPLVIDLLQKFLIITCVAFHFTGNAQTPPKLIYVSIQGNDLNSGSSKYPVRTINRAISLTNPGSRVLIRSGVYREAISISIGGNSERARISIESATGQQVTIKGSEVIKGWKSKGNGVWETVLQPKRYGSFNPFEKKINADSASNLLGQVFFDERPLRETPELDVVLRKKMTWTVKNKNGQTSITANFGLLNIAAHTVELTFRPYAIQAANNSVNFISIRGITISQVASGKAEIDGEQPGAIYTNGSKYWAIENCTIMDCRSVGISIGQTGHPYPDATPTKPEYIDLSQNIDSVGHHQIRANHIWRCGQAGIWGLLHGTGSLISKNLIEQINPDGNFPGVTAGIRLGLAVDAKVADNVIRKINGTGIFMGPLVQNSRISSNLVKDAKQNCLKLYKSHGPILIDNNVFIGQQASTEESIAMWSSEANVFVHNLFYNCNFINQRIQGKSFATSNFTAHTLTVKQTIPALPIDDRWFGNLFFKKGLDLLPEATNCIADHNAYANGAKKSTWGDQHSLTLSKPLNISFSGSNKREVLVIESQKLKRMIIPMIGPELMGFFALSKQYLETPDGSPITVDRDYFSEKMTHGKKFPGPFQNTLTNGNKVISLFKIK